MTHMVGQQHRSVVHDLSTAAPSVRAAGARSDGASAQQGRVPDASSTSRGICPALLVAGQTPSRVV
eukprot:CAMPEP_0183370246 /NCGR_PEP_ID=MMETSP0164_2-20130417/101860_1 /TAXON_ID=221442 /ORGANISM="Coccolithus pelagicus ssp braarudi, Strain PLY182g" /LENGTH=65 /DNA_ID=CAMNT_0025546607 /DNA_START=167 /DNA_END=364 /DNA_ORIENTATION=+